MSVEGLPNAPVAAAAAFGGFEGSNPPSASPAVASHGHHHPPLSPRGLLHHQPMDRGYTNRQNRTLLLPGHVPLSPVMGTTFASGGRSRSRSVGNQPLGWSPQRAGALSPTVIGGGGKVLPGLPDIKLNTSFPEPPIISESQRAMEAAVQEERRRAKAMEKEEEHLTADELRTILKRERHRMARLAADLASMRSMAVQSLAQAEVSEEGRINNLMRRLDCLQQEKGRIIVELEREEEMLTNNLQKKLNEVRREKAMLEKRQMSRAELEARLAALQKDSGDACMSEALEEKEEMQE